MTDIFSSLSSYAGAYSPYSQATSSSSSVPLDNPDDTIVYFEQKFSNILGSLLFNTSSGDDNSTDILGSSDDSSLNYITDFYQQQIELLNQNYNGAINVDSLNDHAALIGKEAVYIYEGRIQYGIIESVLIEDSEAFFKINGEKIAVSDISEIRES